MKTVPKDKVILAAGKEQPSLKIEDVDNVPISAKARIKELLALPLKQKQHFVPPVGFRFNAGPFFYEVSIINPSQLRFTATLVDVNIVEREKTEEPKKPDIKVVSK